MPQRKKRKSTISTESGTVVHPSSKPFGKTYKMEPPGNTGGGICVERKDRKGEITHLNGLKVDNK